MATLTINLSLAYIHNHYDILVRDYNWLVDSDETRSWALARSRPDSDIAVRRKMPSMVQPVVLVRPRHNVCLRRARGQRACGGLRTARRRRGCYENRVASRPSTAAAILGRRVPRAIQASGVRFGSGVIAS